MASSATRLRQMRRVERRVRQKIGAAGAALMEAAHDAGHLAGRRLELGEEAAGVQIPARSAIEQATRQVEALLQQEVVA